MRVGPLTCETYQGAAPKRRGGLKCACSGRCEPGGVESRLGHSGRCAKTLNSYAINYAGQGEYKFPVCSPCMRRMLEVGVDVVKLMPPTEYSEEPEFVELPNFRYWRRAKRFGVETVADRSGVPLSVVYEAEAGEAISEEHARMLAYALGVLIARLRGTFSGRGGKAPGVLLSGLQREMDARNISPKHLALKAKLRGRDHVYKLRQEKRRAYPEQVEAIARVLGCEQRDLLR